MYEFHFFLFKSLTVSGCFAQKLIRQRAVRPDLIRFARCASFVLYVCSHSGPQGFFLKNWEWKVAGNVHRHVKCFMSSGES